MNKNNQRQIIFGKNTTNINLNTLLTAEYNFISFIIPCILKEEHKDNNFL